MSVQKKGSEAKGRVGLTSVVRTLLEDQVGSFHSLRATRGCQLDSRESGASTAYLFVQLLLILGLSSERTNDEGEMRKETMSSS